MANLERRVCRLEKFNTPEDMAARAERQARTRAVLNKMADALNIPVDRIAIVAADHLRECDVEEMKTKALSPSRENARLLLLGLARARANGAVRTNLAKGG